MQQVLNQVSQMAQKLVSVIWQVLQFIWNWSFGQIVKMFQMPFNTLPLWKQVLFIVVVAALAYFLYKLAKDLLKAMPAANMFPAESKRTTGSPEAPRPEIGDAIPAGDVSDGKPGTIVLNHVEPPSSDENPCNSMVALCSVRETKYRGKRAYRRRYVRNFNGLRVAGELSAIFSQ